MTFPHIKGLTDAEQVTCSVLWKQLQAAAGKNEMLSVYYDGHRAFQDLGISIPPQMARVKAALGWPSKVVGALARKHVFDGYSLDGDTDPFDVGELLARNAFELELSKCITSAYTHSCAFLTVAAGDTGSGEPDVLIKARDALSTTVLLDERTGVTRAALTVEAVKPELSGEAGRFTGNLPTEFTLWLPDVFVSCSRASGKWMVERTPNPFGRVMVEPLVYDPQLRRPFGRSRISREVRYLTDAALRELVRSETHSEFFSSPQRYALGVDENQFAGTNRWSAIMGRVWAIGVNEEGQTPTVGQFPQMSMEPHLAVYRQLAQNLCASTNLPLSSVGIFADNPASAEAMQAAEYALSDEAEYQWRVFTPALRRLVEDIVMVRDSVSAPPSDAWRASINWTPARYVSPQASSDFIVKTVQALPRVADTTVALRRAGFTKAEIDEINSETRKTSAVDLIQALNQQTEPTPASDAQGAEATGDATEPQAETATTNE